MSNDWSADIASRVMRLESETHKLRAQLDKQQTTVWDYYAAAAFACLGDLKFESPASGRPFGSNHAAVAAYIADAMLAERAKRMKAES